MKKEFKRIRNHMIEYLLIMLFFFVMSVVGILAVFSDSFKGNSKVTAIVLTIGFSLLMVYLFFLWLPYFNVYRKIIDVTNDEYSNKTIKISKVSLILYRAKHNCKVSAIKIYCIVDNKKDVLYYILKNDSIFYKEINKIVIGFLNIEIYNDSKIIKSLGTKLDNKINR